VLSIIFNGPGRPLVVLPLSKGEVRRGGRPGPFFFVILSLHIRGAITIYRFSR
jgi:hypothetical protein